MAGETRHKIVDVTEKLILSKGLACVTTREIAHETGLSEGTLYRHFDHKEEIFFAVLRKHQPDFFDVFQMHQAGTKTVCENLVALTVAVMHYYAQLIPMSASFFADTELLARYREALQSMPGGPQDIFTRLAAYIEEEQHLGRISEPISALSVATLLLGPCFQRVFIVQLLGYDPFNRTDQQFAEELVQELAATLLPS